MTDIALVWNPATGTADIAMTGPDLLMDDSLQTPIIISLFTDQLAAAADEIPDGSTDRRGWWGDMALPSASETTKTYPIGSKLWLLDRALQTTETLRRAESYARSALKWMIDDGVVGSVTATATYPRVGWINLQIDVYQQGALATFNFPWSMS